MSESNKGAYFGDQSFKDDLLKMDKEHFEADRYLRETYGDDWCGIEEFKGCSVGCTVRSVNAIKGIKAGVGDHEDLAKALNIPAWLVYLQDWVFENCEDHKKWSGVFLSSIEVRADLSTVEERWLDKLEKFDASAHAKAKAYAETYAFEHTHSYTKAYAETYAETYAEVKAKAYAEAYAEVKEFLLEAIKESPIL